MEKIRDTQEYEAIKFWFDNGPDLCPFDEKRFDIEGYASCCENICNYYFPELINSQGNCPCHAKDIGLGCDAVFDEVEKQLRIFEENPA